MNKHTDTPAVSSRERKTRGLAAFGCGCVVDWSEAPASEREQHARDAVSTLVATILETHGGAS